MSELALYFSLIFAGIVVLLFIWIHYWHTHKPKQLDLDRRSGNVTNGTFVTTRDLNSDKLEGGGKALNIKTGPSNGTPVQNELNLESPEDRTTLVLHLKLSQACPGDQVCTTLNQLGLASVQDGLYVHTGSGMLAGEKLYFVANGGRSDGAFLEHGKPLARIEDLYFFMQLPLPVEGLQVFKEMLQLAKEACTTLGGVLQDGQDQLLNRKRADEMLELAASFKAVNGPSSSQIATD